MMNTDHSTMKVVDLKRELKHRGLSTAGNKEELIDRLNAYTNNLLASTTDMDGLHETLIDSELDEDAVLGGEGEVELSDLPTIASPELLNQETTDSLNSDTSESTNQVTKPPEIKRKIVLVRKSSVPLLGNSETVEEDEPSDTVPGITENKVNGSRKIKFAEISEEEKMKLRAKRFGISAGEDKKTAGSAQFGISHTPVTNDSLTALKNRAERFGTVVSPLLSKTEFEEKLRARKARFGLADENEEEKKRMRMERFKTNK